MISYPILLLFTAFFRASTANVDDYKFSLFLDNEETFQLQWKVDKREGWIEFQAIVKTLGWIGIGFSPNGQMSGSDIIIGWVNNDQAFLQVNPKFLKHFCCCKSLSLFLCLVRTGLLEDGIYPLKTTSRMSSSSQEEKRTPSLY